MRAAGVTAGCCNSARSCVVRSPPPPEQVQALGAMAKELGSELLARVRQASTAEAPTLVWLYARVVQDGILGRARLVPAEQAAPLDVVAGQLQETGSEAERLLAST